MDVLLKTALCSIGITYLVVRVGQSIGALLINVRRSVRNDIRS